ncbi:MAG: hypothetical protein J5I92_16700 [Thiogranum sp.]|nr:hypothetical protein [Thiogranum sp.]
MAITSHGFGHAAQVAPVVNALRQRLPSLQVSVLGSLPESFLRERIDGDFVLIPEMPDFGLLMNSAFDIDFTASADAYAQLHRNWDARVGQEKQRLEALAPDLILADIPYLTLAAARSAGIPALALCSLNWADIYRWYFSQRPESAPVLEQMEEAYKSARAFLCPEPSMPMPFLENRVAIGPIAKTGNCAREALRDRLDVGADEALILVAPGGVKARFPMESWPRARHIRWLVAESWRVTHPDVIPIERSGWGFTDLIASCDAVLGKCGYGTVTECVVNRTPLMYIERPDWPEEQSLVEWLDAHSAGVPVSPQRLRSGEFGDLVRRARSLSVQGCVADGAGQAAKFLEEQLLRAVRCPQ